MELILNGSQINLATRDNKRSPTPVQFTNSRPASAVIETSKKNLRSQYPLHQHHNHHKRPFSADSRFLQNNISASFEEKNINNSSAEILKLFISQPIGNLMDTKASGNILATNIGLNSKLKLGNQMTSPAASEESSVEEEIQINKSATDLCDDLDDDDDRVMYCGNKNDITKSNKNWTTNIPNSTIATKPTGTKASTTIPRFSFDCSDIKESDKNLERFRNHKRNIKQKYSSWGSNNNMNNSKNLDLPGRVSFSTNDVMEIDYSDFDDQETNSIRSIDIPRVSPAVTTSLLSTSVTTHSSTPVSKKMYNKNLYQDSSPKKPNNINSYLIPQKEQQSPEAMLNPTMAASKNEYNSTHYEIFFNGDNFQGNSTPTYEANKIIEDYKKEIESINRRHELELHMADQISSKRQLHSNYFNHHSDHSLNNDYIRISANESPHVDCKSVNENMKNDNVINDYYKTMSKRETVAGHDNGVNEPSKVLLNNLDDIQQEFEKKLAENKSDTTNSVIKNYIKIKEQSIKPNLPVKKKTIEMVSSKKTKPVKTLVKPKSANNIMTTNKSILRNKTATQSDKILKKSKSVGYIRQDSNLDEFQMDKVVSWMSINEDNFSEQGVGDSASKNPIDCNSMVKTYNKQWCETATSKTDDEGHFSQEDQRDSDSTYDEIVSVIKEIEKDKQSEADFIALKSDVEFKLNTILNSMETSDSAISEDGETDKLKEIFSYLDNVDSKCNKELVRAQSISQTDIDRSEIEFILDPDIIEDTPKLSDLLTLSNHQLARRIIKLSLRASELSNAIQLSKEHVSNVRADKLKTIRMEKQNSQSRIKEQKKHYEDIVARHQSFIEQLLKDKSGLCDKVTQLTRRIDSQNQAWEHRLNTEVDRAKETVAAGEKIRREKWVRENTKKIKDLTVKGLEIEINNMIAKHQKEMNEFKSKAQQDVEEAIEVTKLKYEQNEKDIRNSYAQDREGAIERERNAIRERFEKQMEEERSLFEKQKKRLMTEFELEKERFFTEFKEKESQIEYKKEQLISEQQAVLERTKQEYHEKLTERELKHQNELVKIQGYFENDFIIWKKDYDTTIKARQKDIENNIRQQCREDRDRQIDTIVAKVDAEYNERQQEFEIKMNRMRGKYEKEINVLESSENSLKEKYIETRTKLGESEASIQNMQATLKQLEMQLNHSKKMCDEFIEEKENLKETARNDVKAELKNLHKERENEIQRIYARVQQAIEKKDITVEAIQKENTALKERCLKMEAIIRQQRKDYCTK